MADKVVLEAEVKSNIGEVSKDASSLAGEFRVMGVSLNSVTDLAINPKGEAIESDARSTKRNRLPRPCNASFTSRT